MGTIKTDEYTATYNDDTETKEKVFERVIAFFRNTETFRGESIYQSDIAANESLEFLSDLADNILKFSVNWIG